MRDVAAGLFAVHALEHVAQGHSLIERRVGPETDALSEGRLAEQHAAERGPAVHLRRHEESDLLECVVEGVGLVYEHDHAPAPLVFFLGEQVGGLDDEGRFLVSGHAT